MKLLTTQFIDPERMKGWVGLVGWPIVDGLPTYVVTRQLQVERGTGKVCRSKTVVLPLCHAANQHVCQRLAYGRCVTAERPGIKPTTSISLVRHPVHRTTAPHGQSCRLITQQNYKNGTWCFASKMRKIYNLYIMGILAWGFGPKGFWIGGFLLTILTRVH